MGFLIFIGFNLMLGNLLEMGEKMGEKRGGVEHNHVILVSLYSQATHPSIPEPVFDVLKVNFCCSNFIQYHNNERSFSHRVVFPYQKHISPRLNNTNQQIKNQALLDSLDSFLIYIKKDQKSHILL